MANIRKLYRKHMTQMFKMIGETQTEKQLAKAVEAVLKIETALAKASLSRVDRRDPEKVYHRLERKGLIERAPLFAWDVYLEDLNKMTTQNLQAINVAVPEFFTGLNTLLKNTTLEDIKAYSKWHLLTTFTESLPKRFVEERFHFTSTALSGQKKMEDRWKKCVRMTNGKLGFALDRSFVEIAYGKEGKEKSQEMIHEIESQMSHLLKSLDWMDSKTKIEAEKKLSRINNKVGYPQVWRSYEGLKLDRKSFLQNLQTAEKFDTQYELNKIGKAVDPNEWYMTPSTVNAYYDPQRNEMVFPAGILQYPFFNRASPSWLNSGAMGVIMGHELTHGFDDQGRQFDSEGNLRNWWDQKVLEKFNQKTNCVVNEYNAFEVLPKTYVNGKLTLGENIADQGGMKLAHQAWKAKQTSKDQPKDQPKNQKEENPTPEHKFFIAFAQSWCQKEHEPFTRLRITIDPHSPSRFRVNGVISQFEPFANAFHCSPGTKMAPAQRCEVW
jgi:predicted metalloendopeptidase